MYVYYCTYTAHITLVCIDYTYTCVATILYDSMFLYIYIYSCMLSYILYLLELVDIRTNWMLVKGWNVVANVKMAHVW